MIPCCAFFAASFTTGAEAVGGATVATAELGGADLVSPMTKGVSPGRVGEELLVSAAAAGASAFVLAGAGELGVALVFAPAATTVSSTSGSVSLVGFLQLLGSQI